MPTNTIPMPYSCSTFLSFPPGTRWYAFSKSTKHAKTSFAYFQDFLKNLLQSGKLIRNATATLMKITLANFDSTISRHLAFKALAIHYLERLRSILRSTHSTFQVGFCLHQQPCWILVLDWLLLLSSMWRLTLLPNQSHVSVGVALAGFNRSSKYFLHLERISFSSLKIFPA